MISDVTSDPEQTRLEIAGRWCPRLAEGSLSEAEQHELARWLEADPLNRAAFEDTVGVWRAVGETSLSADLLAMRRAALESFSNARHSRKSAWWKPAAAACLGAVLLGAGFWFAQRPAIYETAVGERRMVTLDDASKISLDAETIVSVRYTKDVRSLILKKGRAKFDVAHDEGRPFTVAAGDKVVRATGTAFSVELVRREVRVVLYQGHVVVTNPSQDAPSPETLPTATPAKPQKIELNPGNELVAPVATQVAATVTAVDTERSLAWETGRLIFVDEPLSAAIERVNRYADDKVVLGDAGAGAVRIDGVFTAGDTKSFIEGLTGVYPLRARGNVLSSR